MSLYDLVKTNRSYRRFYEAEPIDREVLVELVDYARLVPSGNNRQVVRYHITNDRELNGRIFDTLGWAGYLKDWSGPVAGERPAAYITLLQEKSLKLVSPLDPGIAAQTILLAAVEKGLGGCMLGNIRREKLQAALNLPDNLEIILVIALGKPKEQVVLDEIEADGDVKYWRDENQVHHVPKRKLQDIIINH
ncbi:MAG TPA: nitroreductase family protein [Patescibacteria group bacterium]|nr:nitroreductase family protein [Patescibacteria group bacterium]